MSSDWLGEVRRETRTLARAARADAPDRPPVVAGWPRTTTVPRRIACGIDDPARGNLGQTRIRAGPRAERRRRLSEPDLAFAESCARTRTPSPSIRQGADGGSACRAERRHRGETDENPYTVYRPFRGGRP